MAQKENERNGCAKANRVAKRFDSFRSRPDSIVTIDFGTTHCSLTYLTSIEAIQNPSAIEPVLLKLDTQGRKRVPSSILFDQFGDRKSFGYPARDQYAKMLNPLRPSVAFFEHIKKDIQRKNVSLQSMNHSCIANIID